MRRFAIALAGSFALATAPAQAATRKVEDDPVTVEAREHVARAKVHFKLQEWDAAIAEFKEAYRLKPLPMLLFNIAQASRLASHYVESRRYYESFLRDLPDAPNREEVRTQLAQLEVLIAREPERPAPEATPTQEPVPAAAPTPVVPPPLPTPAPAPSLSPDAISITQAMVEPKPSIFASRSARWGLSGATGVLAIAGAATYGLARSEWIDATSTEHPRAEADNMIATGDLRYHVALGLASAALVAGAGALYAWAVAQ